MWSAIRSNAGRDAGGAEEEEEEKEARLDALISIRTSSGDVEPRHSAGDDEADGHDRPPAASGDGRVLHFSSRVLTDADSPKGRRRAEAPLKATAFAYRASNVRRDGLLKRSEFSTAIQTICAANGQSKLFEDLTTEDLDAQFLKAAGDDEDEDELTPEQFEIWLPTFLEGFLIDRLTLKGVELEPKGCPVAHAKAAAIPNAVQPYFAIRALASQCTALESLDLRTNANITVVVRSLIGAMDDGQKVTKGDEPEEDEENDDEDASTRPLVRRLKRLDLSGLAVSDELLAELAPHCSSLVVLRLGGCRNITTKGVLSIGKGCVSLQRLVLAADVAASIEPAAIEALPHGCSVLRDGRAFVATAAPSWLLGTDDADLLNVADDPPEVELPLHLLKKMGHGDARTAAAAPDSADAVKPATELSKIDVAIAGSSGGCCSVQ